MASLSNNFQLLNSLQLSQKPTTSKKGKKKAAVAAAGENEVPAPVLDAPTPAPADAGDLEGFQPARRSAARTRSSQLAGKAFTAEQNSPANATLEAVQESVRAAHTADDWLSLWRSWILQLEDREQQGTGAPALAAHFRQGLLGSTALEESAVACLSLPPYVAQPFAEVLDTFLGDVGPAAPQMARAVMQLGQLVALEPQAVVRDVEECVSAVVRHVKSGSKLTSSQQNGIDTTGPGNELAKVESSMAELELAASNPNSSLREQARLAQRLSVAAQQRLELLTASSPHPHTAQQAISRLEALHQKFAARQEESKTLQAAKQAALRERAGLLDQEQVALAADIEELRGRLAQLEHRLAKVQQEQAETAAAQQDQPPGAAADDAFVQQMVVVEDLQVLVAGCSTLPDAPLASPAVEEATRSFSSASVRHLQAQLKYQSEVVARGQFAGERMALARQQVGHLRSLHFDREASKAAQAATQHETTLKGLVAESQGIVAAMLAAGKAANAQGCAQAADAAAIGQTLEDLMREAEEGHARLLALLQPDGKRSELLVSQGILPGSEASHQPAGNGRVANGSNHLFSPDTTSSEGLSAAPSIAASSQTENDVHIVANGGETARSSAEAAPKGNGAQTLLPRQSRRRRGRAT